MNALSALLLDRTYTYDVAKRIKNMMSAASTNPLKKQLKNFHGPTGLLSTVWKEPATTISLSVTVSITRSKEPAGMIHVRMAQKIIMPNTMINALGSKAFFFCLLISFLLNTIQSTQFPIKF